MHGTGPDELVEQLTGAPGYRGQLVELRRLPAREASTVGLPAELPAVVLARLRTRGVDRLWSHQAAALELARAGRHVIIATGTASGKSLCYQLAAFDALLRPGRRTALYLAPTKALAAGQLRAVRSFLLTGVRAASYDGDTPAEERALVRSNANLVLTNPDMLHQAILPAHDRWAGFLAGLQYVVIDEAHVLRGVFGSQVGAVLRRLRRVAAHHGAAPTFLLASATVGNPTELARRLTGLDVTELLADGSPRGPVTFALWDPAAGAADGPHRGANRESAEWLARAVAGGVRCLCFARSRRSAEVVALTARRLLETLDGAGEGREAVGGHPPAITDGRPPPIRAYRAGYLAEERRALERDLADGRLLGMAATNALELGIDVGGLDVVVLDGFPGTVASMWQQAGRAGRTGGPSLAVLVGAADPLDAYLLHHPDELFGRPHEAALLDPGNPHILGPQLEAAAAELPLRQEELAGFGPHATEVAATLQANGVLLERRGELRAVAPSPAARIELRCAGGSPVRIVAVGTGELLGTVDRARACSTVHPAAVYLHQGETWRVRRLDLGRGIALVEPYTGDEYTQPLLETDVRVLDRRSGEEDGQVGHWLGRLAVTRVVTGYQRRRTGTGALLGGGALELPPEDLVTVGYWYTIEPPALAAAGLEGRTVLGAAHAAEHAQIALLPLLAMCDRWDIGGLSTGWHPDTGAATIFVYDGYPGGAGIAECGFEQAAEHLAAARDTVARCRCTAGCPSCVHSPKCGNGNRPLDKAGAVRLLDRLTAAIGPGATRRTAAAGRG